MVVGPNLVLIMVDLRGFTCDKLSVNEPLTIGQAQGILPDRIGTLSQSNLIVRGCQADFRIIRGGPEGIRTPYLFDANEALSQLSYRPPTDYLPLERLGAYLPDVIGTLSQPRYRPWFTRDRQFFRV